MFLRLYHDLPIYGNMIRAAVQSRMEYRASFIMYIMTILGFYGAQIAVIYAMVKKFNSIGTWQPRGDRVSLQSPGSVHGPCVGHFFPGFLSFLNLCARARSTAFCCVRFPPLISVVCMRFEPGGFANVILGVLAFLQANALMHIQWSFTAVWMMIFVLLGGVLIQGAIRIAIAAAAFFTVSNEGMQHLFVFSSASFCSIR
jgi:ABC-2 type transport system permease protein